MSVDNTTPRLQLPEWSATDGVLRTDFNNAFSLIDQWVAIAEHGTAAASSIDPTTDARTNSFYYRTTDGTLSWSDGVSWHTVLTEDSVGNGLTFSGNDLSINAGDGLGFTGSALKVNTGATTEISADALIVKSGSLTQTQLSSGYRTIRVGTSAPAGAGVTTGDIWTDTATSDKEALYVRTSSNTWQRPWNAPWGLQAVTFLPVGSQTGIVGETTISVGGTAMQTTFTAVAGRAYRATAYVSNVSTAVTGTNETIAQIRLKIGSTTYGRYVGPCAANGVNTFATTMRAEAIINGLSAGSATFTATIERTVGGGFTSIAVTQQAAVDRSYISIEDLGPVI